jgi:hypothetical protein
MILNAYAVLDAFVSLLRLGLGVLVLVGGLAAWRAWGHQAATPEGRKAVEERCYLLFVLAGFLLALNIVSWPIFYLLLQSYVPQWPGVMCIYGVTRVGAGSLGPARFLPGLLAALQAAKPALVFVSGAWFVLYLVNRQTPTAPLTGRTLVVLLAAGLLAAADAAAELTYLAIPKKEEFLSAGCCTQPFDVAEGPSRFLPRALAGPDDEPRLYGAYYAANGAMVLALGGCTRLGRWLSPRRWLAPLLLGTVVCVAVNAVFLVEVAAPRLLHLPYHHCPYDLVPRVPESVVAVALFVGGSFSVGWACLAAWLGGAAEARPFLRGMVARLLRLGLLGFGGSLVMTSVELALA